MTLPELMLASFNEPMFPSPWAMGGVCAVVALLIAIAFRRWWLIFLAPLFFAGCVAAMMLVWRMG